MKLKIFLILILNLNFLSCTIKHVSKHKHDNQQVTMRKFDLKQFNRSKTNNMQITRMKDSSIVELSENESYYQESIKTFNSSFETRYEYDKNTLLLRTEANIFHRLLIGVFREYDESGKLIREIDYDKTCKITVNELINIIKKNLNIDLTLNTNLTTVHREIDKISGNQEYQIFYKLDPNSYRGITVDCNTGKITRDIIGNLIE